MSTNIAATIVKEAFQIVQAHALFKSQVDWHKQKDMLAGNINSSQLSIDNAHSIIKELLIEIGDGHSHLVTDNELSTQNDAATQYPESYMVHKNQKKYGYIQVPAFQATKHYSELDFVSDLSDRLQMMDSESLSGWVVDLQKNHGGNMWPMLAGLAPLLNVEVAGFFRDADGNDTPWTIGQSHVGIADTVVLNLETSIPSVHQSDLPIAILTSNSTCSSGEAIVVAFRGAVRSRQFGQPTFGLSTANEGFRLSDGSMVWLTTSTFVDTPSREYGSRIFPEEKAYPNENKSAMDLAVDWMNSI